ncbi:hypothetical protein [Halostagnicola sp. A56]|uniref:hypothetical protein n=1 Tax=Halostagnicola sp. A56 TaxID=1495067 RepID=UPI0012E1CE97|nr:hypothetical protein [Halostagnicola sp. A56]
MATLRPVIVVVLLVMSSLAIGLMGTAAANSSDATSSTALPADGPDYGVNESRFQLLWSEDMDQENLSSTDFTENASSPAAFSQRLSKSTDYLFDEPIEDVERWNSGDFDD